MPLTQLEDAQASGDFSVDIVAVHGLDEDLIEAWTDPTTQVLWLQDLLPQILPTARVLTFGYNAQASSFCGYGSADRLQQHAQTLVAELQADRSLEACEKRPIVFVCHGLGGILVKKALAYSSSRTSKNVAHLHSIFVSTYGILFFGTPHHGADTKFWLKSTTEAQIVVRGSSLGESQLLSVIQRDSEPLQAVNEQFSSLMKQFRIFFFWEELPSQSGDNIGYFVEEQSAAPMVDDTERAGLNADHQSMVRFPTAQSSSYRTVVEALLRYCRHAPLTIHGRWEEAELSLSRMRSQEASELVGNNLDIPRFSGTHEHSRRLSAGSLGSVGSVGSQNKHFHIPQVVSSFYTGREDVSKMVANLLFAPTIDASPQQRRFIVHGIGGSGKTQFCSKFAQDHRSKFWGVFWIDATSIETAKQSFAGIGRLGGMEATQSAGKYWLSNLDEPWLLIINNADEPTMDLRQLFPEGERGHVLVSTRNPDFRIHATAGAVEFTGLKEREALLLLLRSAAISEPWDTAIEKTGNAITNTLGYLALALVQAGALMLQRICEMKDYLRFYHEHRRELRARSAIQDISDENQFTIYATFDLSLKSLEQRRSGASADASQLLSIVAFFHFEHIRVDIFTRALNNRLKILEGAPSRSFVGRMWSAFRDRMQPPFVLPDFLRQTAPRANTYRIKRALHDLHSFSLISFDGRDESFSLHPVVHSWARDRLAEGLQKLWAHIALSVLTEAIQLPPEDTDPADMDFRRDILPHLDASITASPVQIFDYAARFGGYRLPLAILQHTWLFVFREQIIKSAKCGYVYAERGRFNEAAVLLCSVKDALVVSRGYRDESTMKAMLALAQVYWGLGHLEEAVDLQQTVVDARTKAYGPENPGTLDAMDQLGRSYWLNGQYKAAIDLQSLTTSRMKAALGLKHKSTLTALDNFGVTCGSWQRYEESRDIHQQVLDIRLEQGAQSDESTLTTMNNLAMALKDLGDLDKATGLMVKVYEDRRAQLGREHPWTLWALCNLAKVHTELKELQVAEEMLIPGIAAAKRSLGEDHLGVLMGEGELARVFARQGRLQEAEVLAASIAPRFEMSRGIHHPDTVYHLHKLAALYEMMGDVDKAVKTCELAADRIDERLTEAHPLVRDLEVQQKKLRALQLERRSSEGTQP